MEPYREEGDNRFMWYLRPLHAIDNGKTLKPLSGWAVHESLAETMEMIEDGDEGSSYEVQRRLVTAAQWNTMPEFEGW